jgi:hypothetical protein
LTKRIRTVIPLANGRWRGNGYVGFLSLLTEAKAGNHPRKVALAKMKNETERTVLTELRHRFPWPTRRPDFAPLLWEMDYGGRELIKKTYSPTKPPGDRGNRRFRGRVDSTVAIRLTGFHDHGHRSLAANPRTELFLRHAPGRP